MTLCRSAQRATPAASSVNQRRTFEQNLVIVRPRCRDLLDDKVLWLYARSRTSRRVPSPVSAMPPIVQTKRALLTALYQSAFMVVSWTIVNGYSCMKWQVGGRGWARGDGERTGTRCVIFICSAGRTHDVIVHRHDRRCHAGHKHQSNTSETRPQRPIRKHASPIFPNSDASFSLAPSNICCSVDHAPFSHRHDR